MITINYEECILCRACSSACPANAISPEDLKMKTYPEKCIDCGLCAKSCPLKVITVHKSAKK